MDNFFILSFIISKNKYSPGCSINKGLDNERIERILKKYYNLVFLILILPQNDINVYTNIYLYVNIFNILLITNFIMSPELIKWLADMPKEYKLSGSKEAYYNGEKQLKLFLSKKD